MYHLDAHACTLKSMMRFGNRLMSRAGEMLVISVLCSVLSLLMNVLHGE
jgi:hypothetical protein